MKKRVFYTEIAYLFGILLIALGTAFMECANFGLSMIVAPAYILHLKVSEFLPFFSFGMASYTVQAIILIAMMLLLKRAKISYLCSFLTAVIIGFVLDGALLLMGLIPFQGIVWRTFCYFFGMVIISIGVSFMFRTYFSPEAYDLFVKELAPHFNIKIHKFKTAFDCSFCLIALLLSFILFGFGEFKGVNLGTAFCAVVNGSLIALSGKILDRFWVFEDKLPLRKFF